MNTHNDQSVEDEYYSPFFGKVRGIYEVPNSIGVFDIHTDACTYRISKQDQGVKKIKIGKSGLIIFRCDRNGLHTIVAVFRRAPIVLLRTVLLLKEREILSPSVIEAFRPTYFLSP